MSRSTTQFAQTTAARQADAAGRQGGNAQGARSG
jgi:hypothetical protein